MEFCLPLHISSLCLPVIGCAIWALLRLLPKSRCEGIPVVGPSGPVSSIFGALRFWLDAPGMLQEGHRKYPGRPFQLPHADKWVVYITDPKLIREISVITNEHLSLLDATHENLQSKYTGIYVGQDTVDLIRTRLSRNLVAMVPEIGSAASDAFRDLVTVPDHDWVALPAAALITEAATRTVNRIFVGRTKDTEYNNLCIQWVHGVIRLSIFLSAFPNFLRRLISWIHNPLPKILESANANLAPLIHRRLQDLVGHGGETGRNDDLLTCIIKQDPTATPMLLVRKLMTVNFASIHTTSNILTHALFNLAASPELHDDLRDEVQLHLKDGDWSKAKMDKMKLLDSFMKESLRLNPIFAASMIRKVLRPVTLSDGSHLRAGTLVMGSPLPQHYDHSLYADADHFDGQRFYRDGARSQETLVVPSLEYFPFGYGPFACPGRLLASSLLKIMLAQIIMNYDVKLEQTSRPPNRWVGIICFPDASAKILFRRRHLY